MALAMAPVPARAKPSHGPKASRGGRNQQHHRKHNQTTKNEGGEHDQRRARDLGDIEEPLPNVVRMRQRRERGETPSEYQRQDQEPGNDDLGEAPEAPRPRPLPDEGLEKGRRGNWSFWVGKALQGQQR
jgi:hypothetical protein